VSAEAPDGAATFQSPSSGGWKAALPSAVAILVFAISIPAAEVVCASASSMEGLMAAWTSDFTAAHPATPARIAARTQFSAEAFDALLRGEVQVAPFARELFPDELARYAAKFPGAAPRLVPVATGSRATKGGTHAIAIFVHEKNPVTRLSLAQLRDLLAPAEGARRITTWGQLGATGAWAAKKISVHGMTVRRDTGNPPGIVNFLEQRVLAGRAWRDDTALVPHLDTPGTGGMQALEKIVRAIAVDEAALGYSGFGYAQPGTRTLALAETDAGPFFAGTADEIVRRDYPLTRTIYLCASHAPDAATRAFLSFAQSPAGQHTIAADKNGFLPLPATVIEFPHGASYLTPSGAIAIVGYNDMAEMLAALTARFSARHPGFAFALDLKGTRTAPPALASGKSALAPMGAEFSAAELAAFHAATGTDPLVVRLAHASLDPRALSGPLAIFVHRDNPLASLTLGELAAIFSDETLSAARGLSPCGVNAEAALGLFFRQRVLGPRRFSASFTGFPQSADVVKHIAANPRAIGFAAAMRATPDVKTLALAPRPDTAPVALTAENLVADRYPLDRHLLLAARPPLAPWLREFLRFALSPEGQGLVAAGTLGYLPLSEGDAALELAIP
jgi:phosphate transport system substrate-binding protein